LNRENAGAETGDPYRWDNPVLPEEFTFHVWDPRDEQLIPRFIAVKSRAMNRKEDSAEWFRWKHLASPWGASMIVYARHEQSGRIVGTIGSWRWRLEYDGRVIEAYQHGDSLVDPAFQRRGLFSKLVYLSLDTAKERGIPMVFGFPNANSTPPYVRCGFRGFDGGIITLVRSVHRLKLGWEILTGKGRLDPIKWNGHSGTDGGAQLPGLSGITVLPPEPRPGCYHGHRDSEWLNYRYAQNPEIAYSSLEQDGAVIFFRVGKHRWVREITIADIINREALDNDGIKRLIARMIKETKADVVTMSLSLGHPLGIVLRGIGFTAYPKRSRVLISYSLDPATPDVDVDKWIFTYGDLDHR